MIFLLGYSACGEKSHLTYEMLNSIEVPRQFLQSQGDHSFGGDLRVGSLRHKGSLDFLVYRAISSINGGATQPCFLGAFTWEGKILWQVGEGGTQPNRPGPVTIFDIDSDGNDEVICLFAIQSDTISPTSMAGMHLQIRSGSTGRVLRSASPSVLEALHGQGPNWVHQRILIANLRGGEQPQDMIIKLGKTILAFDDKLELLWTYHNANDKYGECPAYIPAVGDVDNDGRDEINGGYYLLDHDGSVLWERKLGKNMDSVSIGYWDNDQQKRAICSGHGFVLTHAGDTIMSLGSEVVPHGQELRVADFLSESPGLEMVIRHQGHKPDAIIVGQGGTMIDSITLNHSPNNTGLEAISWYGKEAQALLYNGGQLWNCTDKSAIVFNELTDPPIGDARQGWYHCIAADVYGNNGEEVFIYNPWDARINVYSSDIDVNAQLKPLIPQAKLYNARIMD